METVKDLIPLIVVIGQIIALILALALVFKIKNITEFFGKNSLLFSFIVASLAMAGSLFYSNVLGYEPCKLCWYQRILMYPQVILFLTALYKKDTSVFRFTLPLSVLGFIISSYHYLLQRGIAPDVGCDAVGYSVSCSKVFVMSYEYITIPLMAFTAFVLLILMDLTKRRV